MAADRAQKAPSDGPAGQSERLAEAVRALIREELGRPAVPPPPAEQPSWREAFWLLVFCGNVILILSRLPRGLFSGPAVELAEKLLPALLGSLFVIYLAWFRERLLLVSRLKRFHGLQLGLLAVLIFLNLPVFPLRPVIRPDSVGVMIDGKPQRKGVRIWVACGGHDITLLPPVSEELAPPEERRTKERKFRFGPWQVLRAASGKAHPDWGLLTAVRFLAEPDATLRIRKLSGEFYDEVLERTDLVKADRTTVEIAMNGLDSRLVMLPIGHYEAAPVAASGKECKAPRRVDAVYGETTRVEGLGGCQ